MVSFPVRDDSKTHYLIGCHICCCWPRKRQCWDSGSLSIVCSSGIFWSKSWSWSSLWFDLFRSHKRLIGWFDKLVRWNQISSLLNAFTNILALIKRYDVINHLLMLSVTSCNRRATLRMKSYQMSGHMMAQSNFATTARDIDQNCLSSSKISTLKFVVVKRWLWLSWQPIFYRPVADWYSGAYWSRKIVAYSRAFPYRRSCRRWRHYWWRHHWCYWFEGLEIEASNHSTSMTSSLSSCFKSSW